MTAVVTGGLGEVKLTEQKDTLQDTYIFKLVFYLVLVFLQLCASHQEDLFSLKEQWLINVLVNKMSSVYN